MMKTEIVFETSVSTKAEPHYPAENPKDLLQENILMEVIQDLLQGLQLNTRLVYSNKLLLLLLHIFPVW
jgi:hypothetical protein